MVYDDSFSGIQRIQYPCGCVSARRTGRASPGPMCTSVVARSGPSHGTGDGGVGSPGVSKGVWEVEVVHRPVYAQCADLLGQRALLGLVKVGRHPGVEDHERAGACDGGGHPGRSVTMSPRSRRGGYGLARTLASAPRRRPKRAGLSGHWQARSHRASSSEKGSTGERSRPTRSAIGRQPELGQRAAGRRARSTRGRRRHRRRRPSGRRRPRTDR